MTTIHAMEANFDGLIGPTHNYGGLSDGNLASSHHKGKTAHPREAALQGLMKMRHLHDSGIWQGVLPPQQRPYLPAMRGAGYSGLDAQVFNDVWKTDPQFARNMMSASSMWSANAAMVSPSADTSDRRLHLTPANLSTMLHRSIEHEQTGRALKSAFPFAAVHDALSGQSVFADEGAANHVRLCSERSAQGVEILVYGRDGYSAGDTQYPARQTRQSCEVIARSHGLNSAHTVITQQARAAINAGAFHNDVVCVGAKETLFYHELAFEDTEAMKLSVRAAAQGLFDPVFVEVPNDAVPIADAIKSYLFNSMLVQIPGDDRLTLVAPLETQEMESSRRFCDAMTSGNGPIGRVDFVDVRESMQNGGGPACLRLRVTLTADEWVQVNPGQRFTPQLHDVLNAWVRTHYRETLDPADVADPNLMTESFTALDALTKIMQLGDDFYPFQRS